MGKVQSYKIPEIPFGSLTEPEVIMDGILSFLPNKYWFSLREACEVKNLAYKTACNRTGLQPNHGKADGTIGGKKCFRRETIIAWLMLSDEEIEPSA
jgi:hypothetical protein